MYKHYQHYDLEDFASDPNFKDWVLAPDRAKDDFWKGLIEIYPEKAAIIEEARALVKSVHQYFDIESVSAEERNFYFDEVLEKTHTNVKGDFGRYKWLQLRGKYGVLALAASIVVVLCVGVGIWLNIYGTYEKYTTGYGEWKTVILPDSTQVQLNANSILRFKPKWVAGEDRKVWLAGEAFFEVKRQPQSRAKFVVVTEAIQVEVLGTRFNVQQRGDQTEVFLEEGEIKWLSRKESRYLEPGDFIAYSTTQDQITQTRNELDAPHSSWKDGMLLLKDATTQEVLDELQAIYGVDFQLNNPELMNMQTTLRIPMDTIDIALSVLEKTWDVKISRQKDKLLIH